jgi:hypothetical protein
MSRSLVLRSAVVLAALASGALPTRQAEAQSLFAARGLGLVVEPIDARSQGLGGVALGLPGSDILWSSPAEAVGLGAPGLVVSYQYDSFSADYGAGSSEGTTARFPLVLGAFPAGERWVFTAGYGGFLDQSWAAERFDTLVVGADTFDVVDRFRSTGGAGRLRFGAGYRVMETLAVGLGIDLFTGSVEMTAARTFPGELEPRLPTAVWNYRGVGFHGGAAWRPTEAFSLSAAGSTGGTLEARSQVAGTADASYGLPSTATVGASGQLGADLSPFWRFAFSVAANRRRLGRWRRAPSPPSSPPLILVVDDNPLNVEPLCDLLSAMGYRVDQALDGPTALRIARRTSRTSSCSTS